MDLIFHTDVEHATGTSGLGSATHQLPHVQYEGFEPSTHDIGGLQDELEGVNLVSLNLAFLVMLFIRTLG